MNIKNNNPKKFSKKQKLISLVIILFILGVGIISVVVYQQKNPKAAKNNIDNSQTQSLDTKNLVKNDCPTGQKLVSGMCMLDEESSINNFKAMENGSTTDHKMADLVFDDKSFIENMIPHHEEAVDTSNTILLQSGDDELQAFAKNLIEVQSKEITDMKTWYKAWFGVEYQKNNQYVPMMQDLKNLKGKDLDKTYIKGMIDHHEGAIAMTKRIELITQKTEIKELVKNIVITQNAEIALLNDWLTYKYQTSNKTQN